MYLSPRRFGRTLFSSMMYYYYYYYDIINKDNLKKYVVIFIGSDYKIINV